MEKAEARRLIRRRIRELGTEERRRLDAEICRRWLALAEYARARVVLAYFPMPDEIDTWPIIRQALTDGKKVAAPRSHMDTGRMSIWAVTGRETDVRLAGGLGSPEPTGSVEVDPAEVDIVLVPGRAFDRAGNRLGRGAGFYDGFLGRDAPRAYRAAAAYGGQILDEVVHDDTDEPMDAIVTESETIATGARRLR